MSSIAVCDSMLAVVNRLQVDLYNYSNHAHIEVFSKSTETDFISDIELSSNGKYLALMTSTSKQLLVYELPLTAKFISVVLPRSASKIRFAANNEEILVADKSGDVLLYKIGHETAGTKLLGHLSLLLDVLQTNDEKYIISSDRDEKIRVTCYPNTYNIRTYCLGHKEFVNHIELLPHDNKYLISSSGDGQIKCWDYARGSLLHNIDTLADVNDTDLKENFTKAMDDEGIEVTTLPIVHLGVTKVDESCSLIAVTVHDFHNLLLYSLMSENNKFSHQLIQKLKLNHFPSAIACNGSSLFIYNSNDTQVKIYTIHKDNSNVNVELIQVLKMFENVDINIKDKENHFDNIKVLYKRKFDNVQEYQERKKQRLEKSEKSLIKDK